MCVFVMKEFGMQRELRDYLEKCQSYENDWVKYSYYVHGYWLPYVQDLVEKGLLVNGKEGLF